MEGLESDEDIDDVLQMIWNSSRLILAKYSELLRLRHLNYSWVCLYTIFMAGLANIYAVGCCAQRRKRGIIAFLPPFFDVISDVRECSNILTAICERWDDARGSCDIFNILSMSALKELAATSFQQKCTKVTTSRSDPGNEQTNIQPPSTDAGIIAGQGSTLNPAQLPPHQTYPSPGFPDMAFAQYPDDPLSDPIVDFQQMFQELQNNISVQGHTQTDEVMLGFAQEWFER
ncbi:hypothetical protein N7474_009046 [Penicillium riverlandense]|uniref:uncharacterized protein n=1 Tax=Penicillium riverlandense TaxID=1903569 RepID=UPI0025493D1C|nr:uncharacterized protein N7474_009046 [Penicillium riverlandense]KAJ5807777.1 hypothetical protein N7474_009046 [Penicillium riverlandense]